MMQLEKIGGGKMQWENVEKPVLFKEDNKTTGQVVVGVKEWKLQTVLGYQFAAMDYTNAEVITQQCVNNHAKDEIYARVRAYAGGRGYMALDSDFLALHFVERATRWDKKDGTDD